jgi:hypothetical protein
MLMIQNARGRWPHHALGFPRSSGVQNKGSRCGETSVRRLLTISLAKASTLGLVSFITMFPDRETSRNVSVRK